MNSCTILKLALAGALAAPAVLAQTCNSHIRATAPDARYVVNVAKGTVLDRQTGLTWKRCVEGQSGATCDAGSEIILNWGGALSQAAASTFAGYKDWRIPNSKELESLKEVACYAPAINVTVFPNDPGTWGLLVWSSSAYAEDGWAWLADFYKGGSARGQRKDSYVVRLVRGGQ